MLKAFSFLFAAFVAVAHSSLFCPDITDFPDVDLDRYTSHPWIEISTGPNMDLTFERGCKCTSTNYVAHDDANPVYCEVHNFCERDGILTEVNGTAYPDPEQPAKLSVTFQGNETKSPIPAPYWIILLDTVDYHWAVVWSCQLGFKNMWVLNDTPTMDPVLYANLTAQAEEITGFDTSTLIPTPQGYGFCENYYWFDGSYL